MSSQETAESSRPQNIDFPQLGDPWSREAPAVHPGDTRWVRRAEAQARIAGDGRGGAAGQRHLAVIPTASQGQPATVGRATSHQTPATSQVPNTCLHRDPALKDRPGV